MCRKEIVVASRAKHKPTHQEWRTFSVPVPLDVYQLMLASRQKVARMLQVDLKDPKKAHAAWITVEEAIAVLINETDEGRLKAEIEGL